MSAEPIQTSGTPPFRNQYTRECSRKRPRMLRTRTFSDRPGTPGRRAQIARTLRSISTPAPEAAYSASMTSSSTRPLSFHVIRPGVSGVESADSRSIISIMRRRRFIGATISRSYSSCRL